MSTRFRSLSRVALLAALLLALALPQIAAAANTIVTPANPDGWAPTDVRTDATVGITADQPRSGLGSLKFTTNTLVSSQDKADFTKTWAIPSRTLGALSDVSYEFYRDSSSTTAAHYAPVLRLMFWQDNAPAGAGAEDHTGYLVWEQTYNGINPVPTNAWQAENLFTDYFWMRLVTGPNTTGGCGKTIQNFSVTLNDWKTTVPTGQPGDCVAPDFTTASPVYISGVNTGVGSGWGATFLGYVDNVVVAFGADVVSANFEPNPLCTTVCYADDVNGSDADDGITPATAFKTIQKAIDTVQPGGTVRVLPGSYDETATNRYVLDNTPQENGPHQFGLFIAKNGVTIQGVTAGDVAITDPNATLADITTNATNNFGTSGIFVEGDDVTIAGLEIGPNTPGENKTIEIIGDGFTLKNNKMTGLVGDGAYPYFNDWRYDDGTDTAYLQSYTVDNNVFAAGGQIAISSGAGASGPVSGRQITDNVFTMVAGQNWPSISFNGDDTTVPWYVYPVGGAVITGNTFTNTAAGGLHIRARGVADDSEFDWESYWNDNTYNKAVVVGPNPPSVVRAWSYTTSYTFNNVRVIGADIQPEVDHGVAGDTVLVNEGTYVEQVTVNKDLTLLGEDGKAVTFIKAPATLPNTGTQDSIIVKITGAGVQVDISEFTITGPGPTGCGSIGYGIFVRDGAYADIHDNKVVDIRDTGLSGCQNGNAIGVGRQLWSTTGTADITDNEISAYQKTGIIVDNTGSSANITGNTVSGDGPITYIAENGIQISRGATAEIEDNTVSGHSYTGVANASSAGVLLYTAGTANSDGNTVTENEIGFWVLDSSGTHQNNTISATAAGTGEPAFWGMVVDAPPPGMNPSPVDGEADGPSAAAPTPPIVVQTVVVTGNTFTSNNSGSGVGLATYGAYGALDIHLTATKNIIHNWAVGVEVYECTSGCTTSTFVNVDINRNSIVGNTAGMTADTVDPAETDGTCNWWGNASGPSDAGPGTGDSVTTEVDFTPWLYSNNLDGACYVGGTISIDKVAAGGGATQFTFDVSWSANHVMLTDAAAPYVTTPPLEAGSYSITEINFPPGWSQQSATCDNATTPAPETVNPSNITVADGDAWICTFTNVKLGTIQITKVAPGGGATQFEFDVSWSTTNIKLTNGQSSTPAPLAAGNHSVTEVNMPPNWTAGPATCDNTLTPAAETVNPSSITVANGDTWVCTFNNVPPASTCPVGAATSQWTDLLGIGMGSTTKHKVQVKLTIPNSANLVDLYGQLVGVNKGQAKHVRFIMPGKNNYVQVQSITAPAEHQGGNFWYGADLYNTGTKPSYVTGKWFLQKSGTKGHIPRAFVLYPTYTDAANAYVNFWDTFTPFEGEVYWEVATGWTPYRQIIVPIAAPLGPETFHVELALADNDKDNRQVWVTVTAGGVTQTVTPNNPSNGDQLNLLVFDLANVPAGTDEIVIEVYSPSMALDGVVGDSASLVGMTANYQCSPLTIQ